MNRIFMVQAIMGMVDKASGPINRVRKQLDHAQKSASGLSAKMMSLTKALLPVALAAGLVLGALSPTISTAADFEEAISRVGAVSGAGSQQLQALAASARHLGATTAWSAIEVTGAQKAMSMAGLKTQQVISGLPGVLNLASAANAQLGETANIATNIMSSFGLEASKMGWVGDTLTAAFTSSNTTLQDLGHSIASAGSVASAAGAKMNEVVAMAAKLGDVGTPATVAGTAIKIMFQRLQAPVGKAVTTLKKFGIQTKDARGNMLPMFDILEQIQGSMSKLGTADRAAALKHIFGEEAIGSVTALMKVGISNVRNYANEIGNKTGKAAQVAAQQIDNYRGSLKILQSAFESLKITIGTLFLPILNSIVKAITFAVTVFDKIAQNPIVAFFLKLLGVGSAVVVAITTVTAAFSAFSIAMPFITSALAPVGALIAGISAPVWVVVGAVAALYAAWSNNFLGMKDTLSRWWKNIRLVVGSVISVFKTLDGTKGQITGIQAEMIKAAGLEGVVTTISKVVYRIISIFKGFKTAVVSGLQSAWSSVQPSLQTLTVAFEPISKAIGTIIQTVKQLGLSFLGLSTKTDPAKWTSFGETLGHVATFGFEVLAKCVSITFDAVSLLIGAFSGIGETAGLAAHAAVQSFEWLSEKVKSVLGMISNIGTKIGEFTSTLDLSNAGSKMMETLTTGIKSAAAGPVNKVKETLSNIRNMLPFSDAKVGPLSQLTYSGASIPRTLAQGVTVGKGVLEKAMSDTLDRVTDPINQLQNSSVQTVIPDIKVPDLGQPAMNLPIQEPKTKNEDSEEQRGNVFHIANIVVQAKDGEGVDNFVNQLSKLAEGYES